MPDNPQAAPAHEFDLPTHTVLALHGRDALAFAQAQFMNDVAALADGGWQWNGWLTPKGRVIALFALLRRDAETLWLLLPDFDAGEFGFQCVLYPGFNGVAHGTKLRGKRHHDMNFVLFGEINFIHQTQIHDVYHQFGVQHFVQGHLGTALHIVGFIVFVEYHVQIFVL